MHLKRTRLRSGLCYPRPEGFPGSQAFGPKHRVLPGTTYPQIPRTVYKKVLEHWTPDLSSLETKGSSPSTCMARVVIPKDSNLLHQSKENRPRGFPTFR
jgi:hypothetical protein